MPARRFFVSGVRTSGQSVDISGGDAHKILHVLRLRSSDRIEVIDSAGAVFDAMLDIEGSRVRATLADRTAEPPLPALRVDVAQGIPKSQKMDFVVEKLTELGVSTIFPLESERSVARDVGDAKLERWRRLASAAAQQSGRTSIPAVTAPVALADLQRRFTQYDLVLFPWEAAEPHNLCDLLPGWLAQAERVLIVIGPEGGFSHDEAEAAQVAGARLISLGRRILRTETAAMALLAILGYVGGL